MKKNKIKLLIIILVVIILIGSSLWIIVTDFGQNPFGTVSPSTLQGISLEKPDGSERITLSERDEAVLIALIDELQFKKYSEGIDERKTIPGGFKAHFRLKVFSDIECYTATYISDLKDPNSSVSLLCVNGTYYVPKNGYEDIYVKFTSVASNMFPERRPKLNLGN